AAEIDLSNVELINLIPNFDKTQNYTRGQLLSLVAANEAVADACLSGTDLSDMAIVSSNTIGGMDFTEQYYRANKDEYQYFFNNSHSSGETTRKIASYLGTNALITTISTACSSSANAIIMGTRLIRSGRAKRVLVGGSDPITKFSLNGFASLLIYDENVCKPFDKDRNGLNLGEAGAYLILESEEVVNNKKCYAEIVGYANRNEAFHASASTPDGEGAFLTMKQALAMTNIEPNQISFVHAHGTATPNNDQSELNALKRVFNNKIPNFASSKSYIGHTLGAAGAINAIYGIIAMKDSFVFQNLSFTKPIEDGFEPIKEYTPNVHMDYILSNAFGFGGNNSSIVFANISKEDGHE
ncbi:MAG: beta-ketoacyl-[acyl-carrier-protein] synthase family protein, partial [Bacteroidales bacterium]|nr:beta-ketoacyl-[acyl-carrier-protein] synthase family protein [Bacteroidales bacterium]